MTLKDLIRACANRGDAAAWAEFVRRFQGFIAAVALQTARKWGVTSADLIDDLVQETYLKLCTDRRQMLGAFREQHADSFYAYLKVVTANTVHDHFRILHSQKRGLKLTEELADDSHVHLRPGTPGTLESIQRQILLNEVDAVLRSSLPKDDQIRDRQVFWLYFRQGMTAQAIADVAAFSLSVKGVESLLHRMTQLVREQISERRLVPIEPENEGFQPVSSFREG